jgi:diguanylate cyclase (GGDEF)-like protein
VREEDVVARYGGDEIAILSHATPLAAATGLAERLRSTIASCDIETSRGLVKITVSIGVGALVECEHANATALIALADARLYKAKKRGRNRVCASG